MPVAGSKVTVTRSLFSSMEDTDWPIVNLGEYIAFIKGIVPEEHWERVFFRNANRIYRLNL